MNANSAGTHAVSGSARRTTVVGVLFGGRSVEHDVSIVTGHQVMQAYGTRGAAYEVVPIYIDRDGRWFTGDPLHDLKNYRDGEISRVEGVTPCLLSPATQHHGLILNPTRAGGGLAGLFSKPQIRRLDVLFPAIHGSHGEDGTLQGLFELADIPYVGCGVLASAVANDKWMTKRVLQESGIPVVDGLAFTRTEWEQDADRVIARIKDKLDYPLFVKPVTLGSSIGASPASDENALRLAITVALNLDRRVLVEAAVTDAVEINCAVLGDDHQAIASVLEQPLSWGEFLTFEEKYLSGGDGMKSAQRIIPAPLPDEVAARISQIALDAFRALDGQGITRFDFFYKAGTGDVFLNEPNTMPGSLSFYLWAETGMSAGDVVERLVQIARDAAAEKRRNTYNYQTQLVSLTASRGLKGTKGKLRARPSS